MRLTKTQLQGYGFLFFGVMLWSTAEVVIRQIHEDIGPIQLAWLRFAAGSVLLLGILPVDLRRKKLRLNHRIVGLASVLALLGIFATGISFQFALIYAGASVVATVYGATPIMVFIFSRAILGDPMTVERSLGVILGFTGIAVLGLSEPTDTFSYAGLFIMLFNISCFALFSVLVKRWVGPYSGIPFTALCFGFGACYMLPVALWEADPRLFENIGDIWPYVLYLGFVTTGIAFLCYFLGLERVDATGASSIILLKPPVATVLAAYWLGEEITWNLAGSLVCIVGGLALVNVLHYARIRRNLEAAGGATTN